MAFVFNIQDFRRWQTATVRIIRKMIIEKNDFPMRCAVGYVNRVRSDIDRQTYSGYYAPYNDRYAKWKQKHFPESEGFWHLRGFLKGNLRPFKVREGWFGGISGDIIVPGSSWFGDGFSGRPVSLALYGYWGEYGRTGQPPRPLFNPALEEFKRNEWQDEITTTMRKIREAWI